MSWTWTTPYDPQYDPVFRYKDDKDAFFQTGRNNAEARFWQLKIHEDRDRRQTKSQIEFGSDGDSVKDHAEVTKESTEDEASKDGDIEEEEDDEIRSLGGPDYHYSYGGHQHGKDPEQQYFTYPSRDRSMSIVSTISKNDWRSPSKDYQYGYGDEGDQYRSSQDRSRSSQERSRSSQDRSSYERTQKSNIDKKPERERKSEERKPDKQRQSQEISTGKIFREPEERDERYIYQDEEKCRDHQEREKYAERETQKSKPDRDTDEKKPESSWDKRVNVNRRRPESRARGGDFTGSSYY